jgi:hypothetical protein
MRGWLCFGIGIERFKPGHPQQYAPDRTHPFLVENGKRTAKSLRECGLTAHTRNHEVAVSDPDGILIVFRPSCTALRQHRLKNLIAKKS